MDNLIKTRKYYPIFDFQRVDITVTYKTVAVVPEGINIIDVVLALPQYPSEHVICTVVRDSSSNFAFYSGGGLYCPFIATMFANGEVGIGHWRHGETIPMLVGVFYQS